MPVTRRKLLNTIARLGGAGAAYEALMAFDFLKPPPAIAAPLELPKESGAGRALMSALDTVRAIDRQANPASWRG
jgi:hypothetical protein